MNRVCKIGAVIVACVVGSLPSAPVLACGGGGVTSQQLGVTTNAQRIFMSVRSTGTTDIVAQITVPQTTADYGVLIPVPDEPTLDSEPVSAEDLDTLDLASAPVITKESDDSGGSGCGCIGAGSMAGGSKGSDRGVTVSSETTIGPVVAVSLTADNPDAVRAWLTDNGFSVPDSQAATLYRYVGTGKYFIAIRRSQGAATGAPSSIGVHYSLPGDHRMLSLGFTRIGAAATIGVTLFLATTQVVGPSEPFKALTLSDLDPVRLRDGDYTYAVQSAVAEHDWQAFVLESSRAFESIASAVPSLARLVDSNAVLTRATTVLARERIEADVIFGTPFAGNVPTQRTVSLEGERVRYAGLGSLALLLAAGALRRRSRLPSRE